jgi:tetraacyldisaccharide 4'-kinase
MKTPAFWYRTKTSWQARGLASISWIYGALSGWRMGRKGWQAPVPVLCLGNFTAGGSGKTPASLMVAQLLKSMGHYPVFLSRGYGGAQKGPLLVDPTIHNAGDVGDEPLLLGRLAPTLISRDRKKAAEIAAKARADVLILDDGLQNPSLAKTCSLAVIDAATGNGNGLCLPAGPLRAPMKCQWRHVDALLLIGEGKPGDALADEARRRAIPVFRGTLVPDDDDRKVLADQTVSAFAGIGHPDKFRRTLLECGARIAAFQAYSDHHAYTVKDMTQLAHLAGHMRLVTTEKDLMRLNTLALQDSLRQRLMALRIRLVLKEEEDFACWLQERLWPSKDDIISVTE